MSANKAKVKAKSKAKLVENRDLRIFAEGDSWFSYPLIKDIPQLLKRKGFDIENHSKAGDTLENMVYGSKTSKRYINQGNDSFFKSMQTIQRINPRFVLFSAGGNDVVGAEMVQYLNHKRSGLPLFRKDIFEANLNGPIKAGLEKYISEVLTIDSEIHILMDGYDYPIPNGKKYTLVVGLVGPWILPAFGTKAITSKKDQKTIIRQLVDGYNNLLKQLSKQYDRFHHIDLRGQFKDPKLWNDEIHLKRKGYEIATKIYHKKINKILSYDPTKMPPA